MTEVVPAIIPQSVAQMKDEIEQVSHFAKIVQIDISDGVFTSVKTWPYNGKDKKFFDELLSEDEGWPGWESLDIEVHLMVKSPETVVEEWISTGVSSVVAHIEATDDFQKVIDLCDERDVKVGIAIKPSTDTKLLEPFVSKVDFIQVMGNDTLGKHGAELTQKAIDMIRKLHERFPTRTIGIDIGVNDDTAQIVVEAGARRLVAGGFILKSDNPREAFESLENIV